MLFCMVSAPEIAQVAQTFVRGQCVRNPTGYALIQLPAIYTYPHLDTSWLVHGYSTDKTLLPMPTGI